MKDNYKFIIHLLIAVGTIIMMIVFKSRNFMFGAVITFIIGIAILLQFTVDLIKDYEGA